MPCTDISEVGLATFDFEERLVHYQLNKITCGVPIRGERAFLRYLKSKSLDELSFLNLEDIDAFFTTGKRLSNFDDFKSIVSLCELSRHYLNKEPLTLHTQLVITEINYDASGHLSLFHEVTFPKDLPIEACSTGCKTGKCGASK